MTPRQARRIFQGLIGNEADFSLFLDRFQSEQLLLPAAPYNRRARMVLGEDPVGALTEAELALRQNLGFFSTSSPAEVALKNKFDPTRAEDGFVADSLDQGFTARFSQADRALEELKPIRRAFELLFPEEDIHMKIFWSSRGGRGAPLHYDSVEILVLQLSGTKKWWVEGGACERPNAWWSVPVYSKKGEGDYSTYILKAGDLLYIPAGQRHRTAATSEHSVHLAIGFRALSVRDEIHALLDYISDQNIDFRRSAFGLTDPESDAWDSETSQRLRDDAPSRLLDMLAGLQSAIAADPEIVDRARSMRRATYVRKLPELPPSADPMPTISADTLIRLRELAIGEVVLSDDTVILYLPNARISGPRQMEAAFRYALTHEQFTPGDLPGQLSQKSKIGLVEEMIRYRLVEVATANP